MKNYKDPQISLMDDADEILLGKHMSYTWNVDPKHLVFSLSRYKFVSKMLEGFENVLEIGAGDGFQSSLVKKNVKNLLLSDIDYRNLKNFQKLNLDKTKFIIHDFCKKKMSKKFNAIYALDVLEHINRKDENIFIKNIQFSLKKNGIVIIGMPTIESQKYASDRSKLGHVNCKSKSELKKFMHKYFHNVFMFSMNDEVVHTGYDQMSHYIFALCTIKKIIKF